LYTKVAGNEGLELAGGIAYRSFNKAVFLDQMVRVGPTEEKFRETLLRVRKGELDKIDESLFASRVAQNVPEAELEEFIAKATTLYAENADCDRYNQYRLEKLGNPITEIPSVHTGPIAAKVPPHVLRLAVGAKVWFSSNGRTTM